jgi:hypothetical protein
MEDSEKVINSVSQEHLNKDANENNKVAQTETNESTKEIEIDAELPASQTDDPSNLNETIPIPPSSRMDEHSNLNESAIQPPLSRMDESINLNESLALAPENETIINQNSPNDIFVNAVLKLAKNVNALTDESSLESLQLLYNSKIKLSEISEENQSLFIETFDKLIENESEKLLNASILASTNEKASVKRLTKYLDVFSNESFYLENFMKKCKETTKIFGNCFKILKKIVEEKKNFDGQIPPEVDRCVSSIMHPIGKYSLIFQNYDKEWKNYEAIETLIKISNIFLSFELRNKILNIIKNIHDYEENDAECNYKVDATDSIEQRMKKRKLAIEFILQTEDQESLIRSKLFLYAVRYLSFNTKYDDFDSIHDDIEKERLLDAFTKFSKYNYDILIEDLKKSEITLAPIIKRLSLISYINIFFHLKYLPSSHKFIMMILDKTDIVSFIHQVLNDEKTHEIVNQFKPNIIFFAYKRLILSLVSIFDQVKCFYNQYKDKFSSFNPKILFGLSKPLYKLFSAEGWRLLNAIAFVQNYEDDDQEETNSYTKDIFTNSSFKRASHVLLAIKDGHSLYNSRKCLNMFELSLSNSIKFQNFDPEIGKKFIKLSIQFIKDAHSSIVEHLKLIDVEESDFQEVSVPIIKCSLFLRKILSMIQNIGDKSIDFCIKFHEEESEDGIKVLLDFVNDEFLQRIIFKNQTNYFIHYLTKQFYRNLFGSIHNISKAAYKFKEKWNKLNAFDNLLKIGNKANSCESYYQIVSYMTIANIASQENLYDFSSSLRILETICKMLKEFSKVLADKTKKKSRNLFQINEKSITKVKVIEIKGWNLIEVIQPLYKFAVNDHIKGLIYETLKVKDYIKSILNFGNEIEQEFSLKLLNQLCFDKKVSSAIFQDKDYFEYLKNLGDSFNVTNNSKNYIEGVLWLVNENKRRRETVNASSQHSKHIFISYNSDNRPACLSIKKSLEELGYKIWIDVQDIAGSSIESMAKGIEDASCVLVCMSEKYKQSSNCRSEAEYVLQLKKPFIPLMFEKSYRPDGW